MLPPFSPVEKPKIAPSGFNALGPGRFDETYKPRYFFFYGTLTDSSTLARILDLEQPLRLRSARVVGYSLSHWGQYKALMDGRQDEEVNGFAAIIDKQEQEDHLVRYETKAYDLVGAHIYFTDTQEPIECEGKTFKYAGDPQAMDRRFDPKIWERQTGMPAPRLRHITPPK